MQHKAFYLLFCKFTLHVSGVNHSQPSGVHKTVTTASGTGHILCSYLPPTWPQKIWPVPEAVVTVLCIPDDVCGWHTKHVEWICRIINRLLCVASRWTIINVFWSLCDRITFVYLSGFVSFLINLSFRALHFLYPEPDQVHLVKINSKMLYIRQDVFLR